MPLTEDLPEEDQNYWISAVKTSGDWKQEIYHGMITYMYVLKLGWFICNTIPVQYNIYHFIDSLRENGGLYIKLLIMMLGVRVKAWHRQRERGKSIFIYFLECVARSRNAQWQTIVFFCYFIIYFFLQYFIPFSLILLWSLENKNGSWAWLGRIVSVL